MKTTLIITLNYLLLLNTLTAQVSGISASKLSAINTETVPFNSFEFEPSFLLGFSSKYWDNDSHILNSFPTGDSLETISQLNFRFTYGLIDNLEVGFSIPGDASSLSVGTKFKIFQKNKNSVALITGINTPLGNKIYRISNKVNSINEFNNSMAMGIVYSTEFTENLSLDLNLEYQTHLNSSNNYPDFFINTDLGYYINKIQIILGLYYESNSNVQNSNKFTFNIGTTIERNEDFILVLNFPIDVYGKNTKRFYGFGFAFTYPVR